MAPKPVSFFFLAFRNIIHYNQISWRGIFEIIIKIPILIISSPRFANLYGFILAGMKYWYTKTVDRYSFIF